MNEPSVQIVVVDMGEEAPTTTTISSIAGQNYGGDVSFPVVALMPNEPGGTFLKVIQRWVVSKADYLGVCPSNYFCYTNRLQRQIHFMKEHNLSASYGDIDLIQPPAGWLSLGTSYIKPTWIRSKLHASEFSYEMIGLSCLPLSTMIFDRRKLESAGGFDRPISASYKPEAYLTALAGSVGPIYKLPTEGSLVAKISSHDEDELNKYGGVLSWIEEDSPKELWLGTQFESYTRTVRELYKAKKWPDA